MKLNPRTFFLAMGALTLAFSFTAVAQAAPAKRAHPAAAKSHAKITAAQAEAAALRKYPGKVTAKTKLENEEGVWQYGVMVQSGKTLREIMVNATTGRIDNVEMTNAATENKEAKAEAAKAKASPRGAKTPHPRKVAAHPKPTSKAAPKPK